MIRVASWIFSQAEGAPDTINNRNVLPIEIVMMIADFPHRRSTGG